MKVLHHGRRTKRVLKKRTGVYLTVYPEFHELLLERYSQIFITFSEK